MRFNSLFCIFLQNQKLQLENQLLREKTHGLVIENQELRARLGMDTLDSEEVPETESKVNLVRTGCGITRFVFWTSDQIFSLPFCLFETKSRPAPFFLRQSLNA